MPKVAKAATMMAPTILRVTVSGSNDMKRMKLMKDMKNSQSNFFMS